MEWGKPKHQTQELAERILRANQDVLLEHYEMLDDIAYTADYKEYVRGRADGLLDALKLIYRSNT